MLTTNSPAPSFTLYDQDKNPVSLNDLKGQHVLLLFYPQAFTSVCTKELCGVRDNIAKYNTDKAKVFGISVDSVFTQKKFQDEQSLNFPLLSDFNKEVSRAYGAIYEDWILGMRGVSKRAAFVIDKDGIIQYAEVLENAGEVPDFARIDGVLENLSKI